MANFFSAGGPGYIVNNATSVCEYCAYSVGDQFYGALGLDFGNRWRDLGIFAAFIGSNLIFLFLGVSFMFSPLLLLLLLISLSWIMAPPREEEAQSSISSPPLLSLAVSVPLPRTSLEIVMKRRLIVDVVSIPKLQPKINALGFLARNIKKAIIGLR